MSKKRRKEKEVNKRAWNLFISYSKNGDKVAHEEGYGFVGYAMTAHGEQVKIYRKFWLKNGRKP